jgi:hypothetical protein
MSGDYQLKEEIFQRIQRMWWCYSKVDLFASKRNRLIRTYASVIPQWDPENLGNALRLNWANIKGPILLHPPIPLLLRVLKKFKEEGKIAILIAPAWKGQVWSDLLERMTISTIPLGKSENALIPGKMMKKRELHLPPGNLNAYLLRNSSFTPRKEAFKYSTHQPEVKMNTAGHVNYRE